MENTATHPTLGSITRGTWVRIRKGAPIKSTNPSRRQYETGRATVTEVNHVFREHINPNNSNELVPASFYYAGTGGYWCEANISDIEAIVPKPEKRVSHVRRAA
jgi:hypothetical protein